MAGIVIHYPLHWTLIRLHCPLRLEVGVSHDWEVPLLQAQLVPVVHFRLLQFQKHHLHLCELMLGIETIAVASSLF